jgi:hypothetical protein
MKHQLTVFVAHAFDQLRCFGRHGHSLDANLDHGCALRQKKPIAFEL